MPALAIFRRDIVRLGRSPLRTALMFAVPLVLAAMMGLAFGGGSDSSITLTVLVKDDDDSVVTRLLTGGGGQFDPRLQLIAVGEEGFERMEAGEASALLHIPADFTKAYLEGRPASLTLVKNPAERFMPRVAEEGATLSATVLSAVSRVFRDELEALATVLDSPTGPSPDAAGTLATGITLRLASLERYLYPPLITLETTTVQADDQESLASMNPMAFIFPGLAVLGILFLAQSVTRDILRERESGLVRQLLTAPVTVSDYLLGKTLSVVLITTMGFGLLVAIGTAVGVPWGPPIAVAALVVATALAAGGALILIMSLVATERQQDAVTTIVIMTWSLVGGSMVPLSTLPSFLLPVSRTSLNFWSIDGFNKLILHGGGIADIGLNLAILAGLGSCFLLIGMNRLGRTLKTGDL